MQKASGEWRVDLVEELEKQQTDTILLLRAAYVVVRQTSGKPQHPG
jgi:hypothetical protein